MTTMILDYEHTVLIPSLVDALAAPTHDVVTEAIPALPDYYDGPTAKMLRLPKYAKQKQVAEAASSGAQRETRRSMQEPRYSVVAWIPIALFMAVFAFYACFMMLVIQNINAILYVVLVQWRW